MTKAPSRSRLAGKVAAALARSRKRAQTLLQEHPLASATAASSLALGIAVGLISFALQSHFASAYQAGQRLSGWQNFLRLGAPWQALVPVVLAALLASWASFQLRHAQPEPPISLGADEKATATQLRASLRSERRAVRIAFVAMTGLVGVVAVRLLVYSAFALGGNHLAASTWVGVAIELAVWLAAWGAFWNWNRLHRGRMEGWGVYEG